MKLKKGYVLQPDGDKMILVSDGSHRDNETVFAYSNGTAAFVLQMLADSDGTVTEEDIVNQMIDIYDAPRELIERDVKSLICKIREADLIQD